MDYKTLDKFKTIVDDPSAAPAERAFAQAQLNKAATALVVLNSNKSNWRQRVEARTATVVQEEQDKRIAIVERAEKRARDAAEEQIHHEIRIDKARSDHSVYMTNAKDSSETPSSISWCGTSSASMRSSNLGLIQARWTNPLNPKRRRNA
jgi:hypothetical protein